MSGRAGVVHPLAFAGLLLFSASLGRAQTVGEVAKLPEAQQREIVMQFVNNAIKNLPSPTSPAGKTKSSAEYTSDCILGNLVRALFTQDPKHLNDTPEGMRVTLLRIKKHAAETPNRTVLDVMSEVVDWSFQHFYNDFYTPQKKAEYAKKSDADQVAWFRIHIEMYENEQLYQKTIKSLKEKDDRLIREMQEMYDNAVILSDGRHVLRAGNGDFMVIQRNPDQGPDVKLEDEYTAEAQRLYDCEQALGIGGLKGREACKSQAHASFLDGCKAFYRGHAAKYAGRDMAGWCECLSEQYQGVMTSQEEARYAKDYERLFLDEIAQPRSTDPAWPRLHPAVDAIAR